ncbi:hypothetical protein RUM44_002884 [Polyplax serrata]|uniref:Uncharacterized protein n=1 Tax=Polyplax serrata TaxID=468196 RepID=A0ABR1AWY6_POLSC
MRSKNRCVASFPRKEFQDAKSKRNGVDSEYLRQTLEAPEKELSGETDGGSGSRQRSKAGAAATTAAAVSAGGQEGGSRITRWLIEGYVAEERRVERRQKGRCLVASNSAGPDVTFSVSFPTVSTWGICRLSSNSYREIYHGVPDVNG